VSRSGSFRSIPIPAFLRGDLEALIDHRRTVEGETDPVLFCAPQSGLEWRRNHSRRFRRAARLAGWPDHMTWYALRHLYGVTMLERVPLEVVSKLMGHHSPEFTARRYLSIRTGWLDRAQHALDDIDQT
jgi:integrase